MRRHAKRPLNAKTSVAAATDGPIARFALAILAALCALLLASASASAAEPVFKGTFACKAGNPCGAGVESWTPGRLAVNDATGDVYVIDYAHNAIQVFTSAGVWKSTIPGSAMEGGTFAWNSAEKEDDIAIDNSGGPNQGRVYAVSNYANFFGFNADVSTATATVSSKWKVTGTGEPCGVAVNAGGELFGSAYGAGVQKRNTATGALEGSPIITSASVPDSCQIAFDSANNLYLRRFENGNVVRKYSAPTYSSSIQIGSTGFADVDVNTKFDRSYVSGSSVFEYFDSSGTELSPPGGVTAGSGPPISLQSIATNSKSGRIYPLNASQSLVEIWDLPPQNLFITKSGSGTVQCKVNGGSAEACAATYPEGTEVELVATPAAHFTFSAFSGSCTGATCQLAMEEDKAVTATFAAIKHTVGVTVTGKGSVSAPSGTISGCTSSGGAACTGEYNEASPLSLKATPAAHQKFVKWVGCDAEVGGECELDLEGDEAVSAEFAPIMRKLTLSNAGSGSGSLSCNGGACASEYEEGSAIALAASPASGSSFAGFSGGGCSASPCALALNADTSVTATFNANPVDTCATNPALCPPPDNSAYEACVAKAKKAFKKAVKAAKRKHGKARARAMRAATKRKAKALKACNALKA